MSAHAPFAPSALHRHFRCAGAFGAEEGLPDTQTFAAAEGTLAHDYGARLLKGEPEEQANGVAQDEAIRLAAVHDHAVPVIDDAMRKHIADYVWLVRKYERLSEMPAMIEQRVAIRPLCWGTSDAITLHVRGHIDAIDLKYGYIPVSPAGSEQLLAYILGAFKRFDGLVADIKSATGIIYQPRNGGLKSVEFKRKDILTFEKNLAKAITASIKPDAPRTPSVKGCQWCRAKPTCQEHAAFKESHKADDFADVSDTPVTAEE